MIGARRFLQALAEGDAATAREALERDPALAHARGKDGRTALIVAVSAERRSLEVVERLLAAGAEVDARDEQNKTAMHWAIAEGGPPWPAGLERLRAAGATVDARGLDGWTPLMKAVAAGSTDEARVLLAAGAGANAVYPGDALPIALRGRTLLMIAVANDELVRLLLGAGAYHDKKDDQGRTALDLARAQLAAIEEEAREGPLARFARSTMSPSARRKARADQLEWTRASRAGREALARSVALLERTPARGT